MVLINTILSGGLDNGASVRVGFIGWPRDFPKLQPEHKNHRGGDKGCHFWLPCFCLTFCVSTSLPVHCGKQHPSLKQNRKCSQGEELKLKCQWVKVPLTGVYTVWGTKSSAMDQARRPIRGSWGSRSPHLEMFLSNI